MRSLVLGSVCWSCACGGASGVVTATVPSVPPSRAAVVADTRPTCMPIPLSRPADCPAPASTTVVAPDDADLRAAALAIRSALFANERETADATRTFLTDGTDEERDAQLQAALADIAARERCGDPELGQPEKIADAASDAPLVFFSGSTPTDAGGVGDLATWGLLTVREGCDWKRVEIGLTASPLQRFRDPSGRRVLMQAHVVDQCTEEVRAFVVNSAKPEMLAAMSQSRPDMVDSGVCPDAAHVEPVESAGVLRGLRRMACDEQGNCVAVEEAHFSAATATSSSVPPSSAPREPKR